MKKRSSALRAAANLSQVAIIRMSHLRLHDLPVDADLALLYEVLARPPGGNARGRHDLQAAACRHEGKAQEYI